MMQGAMDAEAKHWEQALANPTLDATCLSDAVLFARQAMQTARADLAIPLLQRIVMIRPEDAELAMLLGYALRLEQHYESAEAVFQKARELAPQNPGIAFGLAQTRYELGLVAAPDFARARALMPGNPEALRNHAAALASEGDSAAAEALLQDAVRAQPNWLDGHKMLATLRWTAGDKDGYAASYAEACRAQPHDAALWLGWFSQVAQTRDWQASRAILDQAEGVLGETAGTVAARFFLAVESGDEEGADALLPRVAQIKGDVTALALIRHFIRQGRLRDAEALALPLSQGPSAPMFWPYLSILWRLLGDARADWLDRPECSIQALDVGLGERALTDLAALLRQLHVAQAPYVEQSVRGGTQTDRSILLRHEPLFQEVRTGLIDALRHYVAALPPFEEGHPLLGTPRNQLLIEGSWSVRLLKQGYNVPHTHPKGWLSTAFYVSLPSPDAMGPPPAGYISFGTPPIELNTGLGPYTQMAPAPGRLAVFPSTLWHSTVPFDAGERLIIALDIRPPRY